MLQSDIRDRYLAGNEGDRPQSLFLKIPMKALQEYRAALVNPELVPTALKVAAFVGSLLFLLNHGSALAQGKMTRDRWISGLLTYCIPYLVNIHGQYASRVRQR